MPIRSGNRRICVFDTNPVKRGDVKYFNNLAEHLENPNVKWAFYQYLLTLETYKTPAEFSANIPITEAYRHVRALNAPVYLKWLVSKVLDGQLHNDFTNDLYSEFTRWVSQNKEKSMDTIISQTLFGSMLASTKSIHENYEMEEDQGQKVKRHGNMYMQWNTDAVVKGLKGLHLLDNAFEYNAEPLQSEPVHPNDEVL